MPVYLESYPDLARPRRAMALSTREAARKAGRILRDSVRSEVPPPAVGKWPGYAAKGRLKSAIVAQEPIKRPRAGDWLVRVGVQWRRKAAVYSRIHEYGGTIRPRKPGGYLVFKLPDGQWIRTKKVRIRRKYYFLAGFRKALPKIQSELGTEFNRWMYIRGMRQQ